MGNRGEDRLGPLPALPPTALLPQPRTSPCAWMVFPDRFYPAAPLTMSVRTPSESEPGSAALSFSFQLKDEQVQEKNDVRFQFQGPLGSQPSLAQTMLPWKECASSWTI